MKTKLTIKNIKACHKHDLPPELKRKLHSELAAVKKESWKNFKLLLELVRTPKHAKYLAIENKLHSEEGKY